MRDRVGERGGRHADDDARRDERDRGRGRRLEPRADRGQRDARLPVRRRAVGYIAAREWAAREQCIAEHAAINKLTGDQQHQLERIYDAARADIPGEDKHQLAVRIMRLASKPPEAPLTMGTYEGFKGSD